MRTFVPLLQLFLVEVGCFLEICQFLLGQFALAIVSHDQLLVLKVQTFHSAAGSQLALETADRRCKGTVACRLVVGVAGTVGVRYLGVVQTRKLGRWLAVV